MATLLEPASPASIPFAELHCTSNYSFLKGASHPEELVTQAHLLGYQAIAITDECTLSGIVKAHGTAQELGIHLIVGATFQLDLTDQTSVDIVVLAPTQVAYQQLSALISFARRHASKGTYQLGDADLTGRIPNCFVLWPPPRWALNDLQQTAARLKHCVSKLWLALELFAEADDAEHFDRVLSLSLQQTLPVVAANDVHMHLPERQRLLDTLTAVRLRMPIAELGTLIYANSERYLRPLAELQDLYLEPMLLETHRIAQQCTFNMESLRYRYPSELVPEGSSPTEHLRELTFEGATKRYPQGIPEAVVELIEKELNLVRELRYEYYFLTVYDIVAFARREGILCQGRGSAANSVICYCLFITEVDPDRIHVLFERFISKERHEPPDIDVDFEHERREEVIQYIYRKYTRDRAALAATLITYRPRSAIRDVGTALGLNLDLVDVLAKSISWWDKPEKLASRLRAAGVNPRSRTIRLLVELVDEILGFPRYLSQHVGGFVISDGPLTELVPVENAAMPDRTVIQWDKNDLEAMNLLKVDVLSLGMLSAIQKAMGYVNGYRHLHGDRSMQIATIPAEDPHTYEMLQGSDSVGVFQVESRAQMSMLPRLKPACFYDLVIEVAIVRPGPIQGNMVHPYLRRRQGVEPVHYGNDEVRRVLERTLGVPIFQEQVIELAMVAAGFTVGEADQLRRAMAAWKRRGGLAPFREKLMRGMLERGHDVAFAERIFSQIKGFGEYGFPESHAASFALLVYISAWLKRHEPAAFYCGILNSQPMGFYSPSQLVQDAQRHGLEVRPVDVQCSGWDYRLERGGPDLPDYDLEQGSLRIGLRQIKGLGQDEGLRIETAQPFRDINDLARRAALNDQSLTFLARAGALHSLSKHRYQAHWDAAGLDRPLPLVESARVYPVYSTTVALRAPSTAQDVSSDYRYLALSLDEHPVSLLRSDEDFSECITSKDLETTQVGRMVEVVGLVTCRQRPMAAKGVMFITLEDECGNTNLVIWNRTLERFRSELLQGQMLHVIGTIEREAGVIHLVVVFVSDATSKLSKLSDRQKHGKTDLLRSRDFH